MRFIFKTRFHWALAFVIKILAWIAVLNLIVFPILWVFKILYIFTLFLIYEALFISVLGVCQILSSYIYKKNSIPYRLGFRTGWFDFKKFSKLKPKERRQYRQEGIIMVTIGLLLLFGIAISHFYILAYS